MIQNIKDIKTPVHLLIELEFSFFRAIVLDENRAVLSGFSKHLENSDYGQIKKQLAHLNILSCQCIIWPEVFTLIPNDLNDETDSQTILQSIHSANCSGLITKSEIVNACNGVLHYGIPPAQQLAIISLFTGTVIKSGLTVFLNHLIDHSQVHTQLSCHVSDSSLWMALKLQNKLEFVNHFKISSKEDVLYYISVLLKDKQLDNTVNIALSGNTKSDWIKQLQSYYTSVEIAKHTHPEIHAEFSNLLTPALNEDN